MKSLSQLLFENITITIIDSYIENILQRRWTKNIINICFFQFVGKHPKKNGIGFGYLQIRI